MGDVEMFLVGCALSGVRQPASGNTEALNAAFTAEAPGQQGKGANKKRKTTSPVGLRR